MQLNVHWPERCRGCDPRPLGSFLGTFRTGVIRAPVNSSVLFFSEAQGLGLLLGLKGEGS